MGLSPHRPSPINHSPSFISHIERLYAHINNTNNDRMKYILITLSLAGLALSTPTSPLAPLSKRGEVIDDSYIVVLKKDVNPQQMALHLAGLEEWHSADVRLSFVSFFHLFFRPCRPALISPPLR
jgi:hypothetical protein